VICPAFVADCLETLEEIGMGGREIFLAAGGEALTLIPALNDRPEWVQALAALIGEHLRRSCPVSYPRVS
jgi:ferrochelatase